MSDAATVMEGAGEEALAPKATTTYPGLKSFLAGGLGGMCLVFVGHPFDLVKVRLQTSKGEFSGAMDVVKKAIATDGIRGLYRGMVPPLLGVTPIFAVSFWGYDMGCRIVRNFAGLDSSAPLSLSQAAIAGFISAIPTTAIMTPVERLKVMIQMPNSPYKSLGQAFRGAWTEGGVRSLFRGGVATLVRDGPGSMAYFAAYEWFKRMLTPAGSSPSSLSPGAVMFAGGMAGIANWAVAIPPDVIKSRIQSAPAGTYSGFLDCARKTVAAEGPGALFKGLGPVMLRAFPANAACFLGVEASKQFLNKLF